MFWRDFFKNEISTAEIRFEFDKYYKFMHEGEKDETPMNIAYSMCKTDELFQGFLNIIYQT